MYLWCSIVLKLVLGCSVYVAVFGVPRTAKCGYFLLLTRYLGTCFEQCHPQSKSMYLNYGGASMQGAKVCGNRRRAGGWFLGGLVLPTKRPALLIATVIAFISPIVALIYLLAVSSGRCEAPRALTLASDCPREEGMRPAAMPSRRPALAKPKPSASADGVGGSGDGRIQRPPPPLPLGVQRACVRHLTAAPPRRCGDKEYNVRCQTPCPPSVKSDLHHRGGSRGDD
ncbi:hypothetical protein E2C01_066126 [Portunus trituberculatus]|uniref:Uncharacterized protein n=1 Tax=Portunus trituberculatus TaxID=210409 RepID=A0A5B7HPF6_PORTR|nr:hypothetical protein [Portunus trituberculatus]